MAIRTAKMGRMKRCMQNKLNFEHWNADLTNVRPQTHLELPYFTVCFGRIVL